MVLISLFIGIKVIVSMIVNKEYLKLYLAADKFALGIKYKKPKVTDTIWKYQIALRKSEYFRNSPANLLNSIFSAFYKYRKYRLGLLLGFDIGDNVFGPGLRINHFGNIVVSPLASVGMWCDIHQGTNIGANNGKHGEQYVPTLGHNIYIAPGVKVFGDIYIGDNNVLGANAVVNKSSHESLTLGGVPAKVINNSGTEVLNVSASPSRTDKFIELYPEYSNLLKNYKSTFDKKHKKQNV